MKQIVINVPDDMVGFVEELLHKLNLQVSEGADVFDLLTQSEQQRLDASIAQADAKQVVSHKEVMEDVKKWVSK